MEENVLKQDVQDVAKEHHLLFARLLFKEKPELCQAYAYEEALTKRVGEIDVISEDNLSMFAVKEYCTTMINDAKEEVEVPVMINMIEPMEFKLEEISDLEKSQYWDVENALELLSQCQYGIAVFDMMSIGLPYQKRMELMVHAVESALEMYPDCVGTYMDCSGKFMTRDQILSVQDKDIVYRFINMYVNVRFFNIQGKEDEHVVDSIGAYALDYPDVQMHFHSLDPNHVVGYVYNVLSYQLENDYPIESNDTIDGINQEGYMDQNIPWTCQYEKSLIQPIRDVLDICPKEFAAGNRDNNQDKN